MIRAMVLAACLLATSAFLGVAAKAEPTPMRQSLTGLPLTIGTWTGRIESAFPKEVLAILRVDDYTSRTYFSPSGDVMSLYVGYHATQRQGASIHSPLNCIPGAGWIVAEQRYMDLTVPASVNGPVREITGEPSHHPEGTRASTRAVLVSESGPRRGQ